MYSSAGWTQRAWLAGSDHGVVFRPVSCRACQELFMVNGFHIFLAVFLVCRSLRLKLVMLQRQMLVVTVLFLFQGA